MATTNSWLQFHHGETKYDLAVRIDVENSTDEQIDEYAGLTGEALKKLLKHIRDESRTN